MTSPESNIVSNLPEDLAVPRTNGELVFEAPWEARAFGVAVALHEEGAFEWKVFSATLSDEIAKAEAAGETSGYYERWLRALRRVTMKQDLLKVHEIADRSDEVAGEDDHAHEH